MVNSQVIKETSNALKIDERVEKIPAAIPVVEVGLKSVKTAKLVTASLADGTSNTLLAANNNADIYIIGAYLTVRKDATAVSNSSTITITPDESNTTSPLLRILGNTLTPQTENISISLTHPLKIKRNTGITITNSNATANVECHGGLFYYIDEIN